MAIELHFNAREASKDRLLYLLTPPSPSPPDMSSPAAFYPASPKEALKAAYVGESIRNIPTPAVVIDVATVRRNCERMLQACDRLKLSWRAHVKTHKVHGLATRAQVEGLTVAA